MSEIEAPGTLDNAAKLDGGFVKAMEPCPRCGRRLGVAKSEWMPGSTEEYAIRFNFACGCTIERGGE